MIGVKIFPLSWSIKYNEVNIASLFFAHSNNTGEIKIVNQAAPEADIGIGYKRLSIALPHFGKASNKERVNIGYGTRALKPSMIFAIFSKELLEAIPLLCVKDDFIIVNVIGQPIKRAV